MYKQPKISVVIATHNNIAYIGECLDGILNQAFEDIEVIIVDVMSDDGTKELVEEVSGKDGRVIYLADSFGSLGRARNIALDRAKADYVVFIEAEEYISDDFFPFIYKTMEGNPGLDIAACGGDFISDNSYGANENHLQMESRVFRWQVFNNVCGYRKSFLYGRKIRFFDQPGYGRQDIAFKFLAFAYGSTLVSDASLCSRGGDFMRQIISESQNVNDVCDEYNYLRRILMEDKDTWQRLRFAFWDAYFISNMEYYENLAESLKPMLSKRMQADIAKAVKDKEAEKDCFDLQVRDEVLLLMESWDEFDRYQIEKALNKKARKSAHLVRIERIANQSSKWYGNEGVSKAKCHGRDIKEKPAGRLDKKWLTEEMGRDMASLRLLLGLSHNKMANLLGVSAGTYRNLEAGKKEVTWDQYMALLFLFIYNHRTASVVETLGLYPEPLKLRMKKGIVGNVVAKR